MITLVRHGSTSHNSEDTSMDRIRGWKDIPLSPEGRVEARKIARDLEKNPPDVLATSDLSRAADTAEIISQQTGVPVSVNSEAFRPWNVGKYAGQKTEEVMPILKDYVENKPEAKLPEGESFCDFQTRFFDGLATLMDMHPGKNIAIVSHHRNERLLAAWQAEGFPVDGSIDKRVFGQKGAPPASIATFNPPEDKLAKIGESDASEERQVSGDDQQQHSRIEGVR